MQYSNMWVLGSTIATMGIIGYVATTPYAHPTHSRMLSITASHFNFTKINIGDPNIDGLAALIQNLRKDITPFEIDLDNRNHVEDISSYRAAILYSLINPISLFAINKSFDQLVSASNPNTFLAGTALAISGTLYIYSAVQAIRLSNMREFIVKTNDDKSFYSGYKSPYHLATTADTIAQMTEDNVVYYNKIDEKLYYKPPNKAAIEVIAKKIDETKIRFFDTNGNPIAYVKADTVDLVEKLFTDLNKLGRQF